MVPGRRSLRVGKGGSGPSTFGPRGVALLWGGGGSHVCGFFLIWERSNSLFPK